MALAIGQNATGPVVTLGQKAGEPGLTTEQKRLNIESFEFIWSTIRDQYWDPTFGGVNWLGVHHELRPQIERASTMAQARAVMRRMMERLGKSHFGIIPADVYGDLDANPDEAHGSGTAGFDVRVLDEHAVVTSVEDGSPAAAQGVHPGWEILGIDGAELAPVLRRVGALYRDSTARELYLARAVTAKLSGDPDSTVRVQFLDGANARVTKQIERVQPQGLLARFGYLPPMHVWIKSRKVADNVGYLAFNLFLDPARLMPEFGDAVRSCAECAGIIIDLRGNPGGLGIMAMGMAGWFIEKPDQRLGTMHTRQAPLKFTESAAADVSRASGHSGGWKLRIDLGSVRRRHERSGSRAHLRNADGGRRPAFRHRPAAQRRRLSARAGGLHLRRRPAARRRGRCSGRGSEAYACGTFGGSRPGSGRRDRMDTFAAVIARRPATGGRTFMNLRPGFALALIFAAFTCLSTLAASDEALPKGDVILDKFVVATGGKAAYDKVHTEKWSGTFEFVGKGVKGAVTSFRSEPNKSVTVVELEGIGAIQDGTDGETAWTLSALQGARIKLGDERAIAMREAMFRGPAEWRKLYKHAETTGAEAVDGQDCYKVVLTPNEGKPETRYFNKKTNLLVKLIMQLPSPMGEIPTEALLSDYQGQNGLLAPRKVRQKAMGQEFLISIDQVEYNLDLPKDRFDLPAEIKALATK